MRSLQAAAHYQVFLAIRDGHLVREPCEICGCEPVVKKQGFHYLYGAQTVVAHHDDYAKPLDVRWLCRKHHYAWHRQMRADAA